MDKTPVDRCAWIKACVSVRILQKLLELVLLCTTDLFLFAHDLFKYGVSEDSYQERYSKINKNIKEVLEVKGSLLSMDSPLSSRVYFFWILSSANPIRF